MGVEIISALVNFAPDLEGHFIARNSIPGSFNRTTLANGTQPSQVDDLALPLHFATLKSTSNPSDYLDYPWAEPRGFLSSSSSREIGFSRKAVIRRFKKPFAISSET